MTLPPDPSQFLAFAHELADASGRLLREASQGPMLVDIKPDASYVTATDRAIETRFRELIEARYPAHGIYGEEFGRVNEGG
jgi:fructose-1,6-bisphosphatase/inositol monophosphatase family enzyme